MFKKLTLSLLLAFGMQVQAAEASGQASYSPEVPIQEVTEMADMPEDVGGFNGSVEFKYKNMNLTSDEAGMGNFSYRARAGWTGSSQSVKWGVGFSSNIEQAFSGYELKNAFVEQAYVKYAPVENFSVKMGKSQWKTNYNYTGVLVDDDLYKEALSAKFKAEVVEGTKVYVKVAAVKNEGSDSAQGGGHEDLSGPFKKGVLAVGKVGVKSDVGMAMIKGGVAVKYDGFADGEGDDKAYGSAYLNAGSDDVAGSGVGLGAFGVVGGNVDFDSWTYTGGVYVGSANPEEANEYSASVSYYNVESKSWNTGQMDTDYVATAGDGNGVAARVQYNVWDNVSVVGKYSFVMKPAETHNVVGEVTFNF